MPNVIEQYGSTIGEKFIREDESAQSDPTYVRLIKVVSKDNTNKMRLFLLAKDGVYQFGDSEDAVKNSDAFTNIYSADKFFQMAGGVRNKVAEVLK